MRRTTRPRSGAAAIEMALAGSLILILIFGLMEWSWYLFQYFSLERASERGVRMAAAASTEQDPAVVAQAGVDAALRQWGVQPSRVTVVTTVTGATGSQVVTVDLTLPDATLVGLVPSPTVAHTSSSQRYEEALPR